MTRLVCRLDLLYLKPIGIQLMVAVSACASFVLGRHHCIHWPTIILAINAFDRRPSIHLSASLSMSCM